MSAAVKFKLRGNDFFKAGRFKEASFEYEKAEKADPSDPVYPSNLSAALFEVGDYVGCVNAVLRSWALLKNKSDMKPDLLVRLSTRLAKALCHGVRDGSLDENSLASTQPDVKLVMQEAKSCASGWSSSTSEAAIEALNRAWNEWNLTAAEMDEYSAKRPVSLSRLSRLPLFCQPLDPLREYYVIGMDALIDLTKGWMPNVPFPLNIEKMPMNRLDKIAFLYGGVGDGRHVLSTVCGLRDAYKKLPTVKRAKFHAHLTLLDIHPVAIARDLCTLMLLHQLGKMTDDVARTEITATLMYSFCGAVMPSYCYDRLQTVMRELRKHLSAQSDTGDLPPWLHVVSDTAPAVVAALDYWLSAKKTTGKMLAHHENMAPYDRPDMFKLTDIPGAHPAYQQRMRDNLAAQQESLRKMLLSMSDEELMKMPWLPPGASLVQARAVIEDNVDAIVEDMQKAMISGNPPTHETVWYNALKVFVPPPDLLDRHAGFRTAWEEVRAEGALTPTTKRQVMAHIEKEWRPNITLFDRSYDDRRYSPEGDHYRDVKMNMFTTITQFGEFNSQERPSTSRKRPADKLAWDTCKVFFGDVAEALRTLESHITLEAICGGLSEELSKMRFKGDAARPENFPRQYTRMWLSNVPDYTHGPLNMILYVLPNLQPDPQAIACCNCLLNSGVWADDEEYMHTYTLLTIEEVPRYLACRVVDSRAVIEDLVLGSKPLPRPLSELATRDELNTWLTRILFNTFLPARSKPIPSNVRLPHNLVAFFGLIMYLHQVGYPGHWLSDFLARVLSGRMVSTIAPYEGYYPIPVSERSRRVPSRTVRTDPWLVEFETIIATAYYAIPFPIAAALPDDFSRDPDDVAVWEVFVQQAQVFTTYAWLNCSPYEPRTHLLFYRSDLMTVSSVIGSVRGIFEGRAGTPVPGTFFILTAQEHVRYQETVRFRLSKARVERMRTERWSMVAYRNDNGEIATQPAPIQRWMIYEE